MRLRTLLAVATLSILAVPASACASFTHTVSPGESLSSVAAADGLPVSQLAAANGLSPEAQLTAGSLLVIPPQGEEAAVTSTVFTTTSAASSSSGSNAYLVQPGDTLSEIAARAGLSVAALAAANGLDPDGSLLAGTTIYVPSVESTRVESTYPEEAEGTSQNSTSAEGAGGSAVPYTTQETVTPSQVGSIAVANGVPASLAEAIAEQESGFNNGFVSAAGASGVMQILPGTWSWVDSTLAGPAPLEAGSALENVRAGVLLLRSLLEASEGEPALAAAEYYQGVSSVKQNGEYPETQQYVDDVMALQQAFEG